ncbi:hypothetical protein MMAD_54960 (plasmid) [Mycolicibacterium madagascariense]|uniref:Mrr-like domain-containing protein n=1 Tax=Mycolicibacterium madagascariense TaxID=212765 RepID=A0A7I7XPM6_9MYCO|nr:hypothetical protein MMAD_54960 [Mycolicibacterium madagascariense]
MAQYLPLDSVYGRLFKQVWLWKDWPGRAGKIDTGIDLVAEEVDTGDLWAINASSTNPITYWASQTSTRSCPHRVNIPSRTG